MLQLAHIVADLSQKKRRPHTYRQDFFTVSHDEMHARTEVSFSQLWHITKTTETVAPLLCIGSTSFIAISTLTTSLNFYSKLISKQDPLTGLPMFKSVQIQLACQACIEAEKAHECVHMNHLIPRWQDSDKHRRLKTIMSDRPVGPFPHAFTMICMYDVWGCTQVRTGDRSICSRLLYHWAIHPMLYDLLLHTGSD